MGNYCSCLVRTIGKDRQEEPPVYIPLRQNRSSPLRTRNESIRFIEEDPGDEQIPSTSSEHQSSTSHGGEVVRVRSSDESIQSSEMAPVEQLSTSSEQQPSTSQTHEGEVSLVNVCLCVPPLIMDRMVMDTFTITINTMLNNNR